MSKEYITKAHYPQDTLSEHTSSYGLCIKCSSFSTYVPYPCPIVEEANNE